MGARPGSRARVEQILHERAQYVFATLEPELQMAGYFGLSPPPAPLAADVIPVAAQQLRRCADPAAGPAGRSGAGLRTALRRARWRRAERLDAAHHPPRLGTTGCRRAGRAQWLGSTTAGQLVWNDTGGAATPAGTERRDLLLRVYYVARAADGDAATPALRVKSLSSIAGVPAFIDTEVMPGVEALQAELLPAADAPRSVRITLTVRADQAELHTARRCGGSPSRASSRCAMRPQAEGFAVLVVLALLAVIGLYTAATLQDSQFGSVLAGTRVFQQRAFMLADLGIERACRIWPRPSRPPTTRANCSQLPGSDDSTTIELRTTGDDALPAGFSAGRFSAVTTRSQHRPCAARRRFGAGAGRIRVYPCSGGAMRRLWLLLLLAVTPMHGPPHHPIAWPSRHCPGGAASVRPHPNTPCYRRQRAGTARHGCRDRRDPVVCRHHGSGITALCRDDCGLCRQLHCAGYQPRWPA